MKTHVPTIFVQDCNSIRVVKNDKLGCIDIRLNGDVMIASIFGPDGEMPEFEVVEE